MSSKLFSPIKIGPLELKNRFMRSPCYMHGCDNQGFPEDWLLKLYRDIADGEMGLILPGYFYMSLASKASPGQGCIYTDRHAQAWKTTVDYVHQKGSKIIFQVCDAGAASSFELCKERPRGASPMGPGTREMTKMEINEMIEDFTKAAVRLQNIGVDGIEIQAAFGYSISQFLSPAINKRTDEYGGSPENRRRILQEIVTSIRNNVDKNFAVAAKINVNDYVPGGVTPEDLSETIKHIKGIDFYEMSCSILDGSLSSRGTKYCRNKDHLFKPGYNVPDMAIVHKSNPNVALAVSGGFTTIKTMEHAIDEGASLIGLGRASIADPRVVKHLRKGENRVRCIYCSECLIHAGSEPVHCHQFRRQAHAIGNHL